MKLSDFDFTLPQDLIAAYPLKERTASRLLCMDAHAAVTHRVFAEIIDVIEPGDLLVFNDTKVIPARLFAHRMTGGSVEILVERVLGDKTILAQVRASKTLRPLEILVFANKIRMQVLGRNQQFYELALIEHSPTILEVIEAIGHIPLPPYMQRAAEQADQERYQTVYAAHKGSVAAPTAGLHFDLPLLQRLQAKQVAMAYLTLHIGAGTFTPVRTENIEEHQMHAEYLEVSEELCQHIAKTRALGKRVIAVGTTSMRALESASQSGKIEPYCGETNIFIYPGYRFQTVDALISNFHLPFSSLLMLVCAFAGHREVMAAYANAVRLGYRFYSYGDAMWLCRK
jgi:S-adenosylmethionine:tRNA ribosyltransferase-isomerase